MCASVTWALGVGIRDWSTLCLCSCLWCLVDYMHACRALSRHPLPGLSRERERERQFSFVCILIQGRCLYTWWGMLKSPCRGLTYSTTEFCCSREAPTHSLPSLPVTIRREEPRRDHKPFRKLLVHNGNGGSNYPVYWCIWFTQVGFLSIFLLPYDGAAAVLELCLLSFSCSGSFCSLPTSRPFRSSFVLFLSKIEFDNFLLLILLNMDPID